jgi:hypothetical protein
MKGWTGSVNLNRQSGNIRVNSALWATSPGFEANDLGYQSGGDIAGSHIVVNWRKPNPDKWSRSRYLWFAKWWTWDYGRKLQGNGWKMEGSITTKNYWTFRLDVGGSWKTQGDYLTRGGPAASNPGTGSIDVVAQSDSRKRVSLTTDLYYGWNDAGGWNSNNNLSISLKPTSFLTISTGPNINRSRGISQYVNTVVDATVSNTYGSRYVFSDIDQFQVSMTTRVNWILSPKMSFQVYLQPLISVGDYWGFKEYSQPSALSFSRYGSDIGNIRMDANRDYMVDPDGTGSAPHFHSVIRFNFKSMKVNAIFRWEFRLGSTLYLVWTQNRQDFSSGAFPQA